MMKSKGILFLATIVIAMMTLTSVYALPGPIVHSLSPANNAILSTNPVTIQCSVQSNDVIQFLKNVTLYANFNGSWVANETQPLSGQGMVIVTFTKTVSDGKYNWNCYACDTWGNCAWSQDGNFSFTMDTQAPDSNVTYATKDDGSDRRNCAFDSGEGRWNTYVNYGGDNLVLDGISKDTQTKIVNIEYIRSGWNGYWVDAMWDKNPSLTEYWYTRTSDYWDINREYKVCGRARDSAGNQENDGLNVDDVLEEDCCWVCIDLINPTQPGTPTLDNPSQCVSNYVNEAPRFTWERSTDQPACDDIDYYEIEVYYSNGELFYVTTTENNDNEITLEDVVNGQDYYIRVRAWDKAKNHGDWSAYSEEVYYDTENPKVEITAPEAGSWFNMDFQVSETDSDNLALWKCFYQVGSSGWMETVCNVNITADISEYCPVDGSCTVGKKVVDNACNDAFDRESYNIDRTPPVTTKEVLKPTYGEDWYYVTSDSLFNLYCSDGIGIGCDETYYRYQYPDGNWTGWMNYEAAFNLVGPDGGYLLQWYSTDLLGNTETTHDQRHYLDNTAPVTTKIVGNPKYPYDEGDWYVTNHTTYTLTCSDGSGSGCDETYYRVNGGNWMTYANPFVIDCLKDGQFTLEWYSNDNLGNKESIKSETDFMDNTKPTIVIENPDATLGCAMLQFDVIAKVIDPIVGDDHSDVNSSAVYARIVGVTDWVKMTSLGGARWSATFSNMIDAGNYDIEVKASDNVENENTVSKEVAFLEDIYWEVEPESCTLNWQQGGNCSFNYRMTLCHGGNAVAMTMHKLCCQTWLNPTLDNWQTSVFVRELFKDITPFWYEASLLDAYLPGWCNNNGTSEWNYISLANFADRTGDLRLNFTLPQLQSGGMCEKMYYAVRTSNETNPRVGYFDIDWLSQNKVRFSPHGVIYAECGNGLIESDEQCDGSNLNEQTCIGKGYDGGALKCSNACRLDYSSCTREQNNGGNGGSSYGGSGGSCISNYECSSWGICSPTGTQWRVCRDETECGTTNNAPEESRPCEIASSENVASNENANPGNMPITGNTTGSSVVVGGALFGLIVALAIVVTVVVRRVGVKGKK